jgi:hypothetical protein
MVRSRIFSGVVKESAQALGIIAATNHGGFFMTADRSAAAKKAAVTRKRRAAGKKAAQTKKRIAAGRKAAATRKLRLEQL